MFGSSLVFQELPGPVFRRFYETCPGSFFQKTNFNKPREGFKTLQKIHGFKVSVLQQFIQIDFKGGSHIVDIKSSIISNIEFLFISLNYKKFWWKLNKFFQHFICPQVRLVPNKLQIPLTQLQNLNLFSIISNELEGGL